MFTFSRHSWSVFSSKHFTGAAPTEINQTAEPLLFAEAVLLFFFGQMVSIFSSASTRAATAQTIAQILITNDAIFIVDPFPFFYSIPQFSFYFKYKLQFFIFNTA